MENITDIHEEVFNFLEKYRLTEYKSRQKPFFYTLRRSNQKNRLDEGYWFYGNEYYLAVSFWSGMDWKNKTPNIYFSINYQGFTHLCCTSKDSIDKSDLFTEYFVNRLDLKPNGKDMWIKHYDKSSYLDSLYSFLVNDKILIDEILRNGLNSNTEDISNSIRFINSNEFHKWFENVNLYRQHTSIKTLPFSLTSFKVQKYEPIINTSFGRIPSNTPFIILVGENGSGKSSLLHAIALGLGNKFIKSDSDLSLFTQRNSPWLINFGINNNQYKITYEDSKLENELNMPFVCYGASRLMTEITINEVRYSSVQTEPLYSLFYPNGILKDINKWLYGRLAISEDDRFNSQELFDNIKQMIIDIVPNLYDIRNSTFEGTLLYFEEDFEGNKIEKGVIFQYLSSGLKSLIAMLGDMMLRLFEQQLEITTDPAQFSGIVLIDEIDVHLHPKWQKKLPEILSDNFPLVQFIITTHSPIPLLGVPRKSQIFNISRSSKEGVLIKSLNYIDFSNLLPNTILTSPIFNLQEIIPKSHDRTELINTNDNYSDIIFYKILDEKLNQINIKYLSND